MNRSTTTALIVIGALFCAGGGWLANDWSRGQSCPFKPNAYGRLRGDLNVLPEYPLERVSDDTVAQIQRCWVAHPYGGPQHVLHLVGARQASNGTRYLIFAPWGITDLQLVFSVNANNTPTAAYLHETF
jgi:hypothetical protein